MTGTKKKKLGPPLGAKNNPTGKNQWENNRSEKPMGIRLLKELDEWVREQAKSRGITLTEVVEEAIIKAKENIN